MTIQPTAADAIRKSGQFESTITQLMDLERVRKRGFERDQATIRNQQKLVNDISSDLTALNNAIRKFSTLPGETLRVPRIESSNTSAVKVRAITDGIPLDTRNSEVEVLQTARADRMNSATFTDTATTLDQGAGTGSFEFRVNAQAAPVLITVETAGKTDLEILQSVATQLNQQLGADLRADVLQVRTGESALSIQQKSTGSTNAMSISAFSDDFAGLTFNQPFQPADLDARVRVNGILFERNTNSIDNIIPGLQLDIEAVTTSPATITVSRDSEATVGEIEKFIEAFNKLNTRIRVETVVSPQSGGTGLLARERQVRALSTNLRNITTAAVPSMVGTTIQSLSDLGITSEVNGNLSITDRSKLIARLNDAPELVEQFFTNGDGLVARMDSVTELYANKTNGLLGSIRDGFDFRLERLNDRIAREDTYLFRREEQLRAEFGQLEQLLAVGQNQMNQIVNFGNRINSFR